MKKHLYIFLAFMIAIASTSHAQSLSQAKTYYNNKEYAKAKPVFKKLAKRYRSNGKYNYWYGVCCFMTNEKELAEKHLLVGTNRKIENAFYYLGELYYEQYKFEDAIKNYEIYIGYQEKRKHDVTELQQRVELAKQCNRLLKGVVKITFIDSISLDKKDFLSAYHLSKEAGNLSSFQAFFQTDSAQMSTVYQTEMQNKICYSTYTKEQQFDLFSQNKLLNKWAKPHALSAINTSANENYPYLLADGLTLYYASDGEGSIGGYDIFATRYSTNTDSYLKPINIGMPFNSIYNDYMYVLDEYNQVGWFATDRNQPEGRVCIYTFLLNDEKEFYNYEKEEHALIRQAALYPTVLPKESTDPIVLAAKARIKSQQAAGNTTLKKSSFAFVVTNTKTYYHLSDFKSAEARQLAKKWITLSKEWEMLKQQLQTNRKRYHQANAAQKAAQKSSLLDLENKEIQTAIRLKELAKEIRKAENK